MPQIYAAGPAGTAETEVSECTGAGGRKINWGNQQVQSPRGDVNSSETRWAVGARSGARLVSHVFSFLAAGLIECSLCYLWLWGAAYATPAPRPPQHLQTIPNVISTKGTRVQGGSTSDRAPARLAQVSTVVRAF